MVGNRSLLSNY